MSKKLRVTRYAELESVRIIANDKIKALHTQTAELKLHADALVNILENRVDPNGLKPSVRKYLKTLATKQVEPMASILNTIRQNLDPQMQAKFDKNFGSVKKFNDAMANYMKGHDNLQIMTFLAKLPQIISEQNDSRDTQINALNTSKATADKKLNNGFIRFFLKLAHYLTPYHMSPEQVAAQKQDAKALVARKGGSENVEVEAVKARKIENPKTFAQAKAKFRLFDKQRQKEAHSRTSKTLEI